MAERLRECGDVQEPITQAARDALVGTTVEVLVDAVDDDGLVGRTHREAPEIDGVVRIAGAEGRPGARGHRRGDRRDRPRSGRGAGARIGGVP